MGPASQLFRRASGDGEVKVPAKDWNLVAHLARAGAIGLAHRTREGKLTAAVGDGRIERSKVANWRAAYNRDPMAARAALDELQPNARRAAANAAASAPRRAAASSTAPRAAAQVQTADDGSLSWQGHPVRLNAAGRGCVYTTSGWMDVNAAASAGVTAEALRAAIPFMPEGPAAREYREGPNPQPRGGGES
jgi:hypothetical protein